MIELQVEHVAVQILVAVAEAVLTVLVEGRIALRIALACGAGDAGGAVAEHWHIVVVAPEFIVIGTELQVLHIVEPVAELEHQVMVAGVLDLAGVGDADQLIVGVVEGAALLPGGAEQGLPVAVQRADPVIHLVAQAVVAETIIAFQADPGMLADAIALGAAADEVDDTASGATTMLGRGAMDHLDALDLRQVDGVATTPIVTDRAGLWHAIDEELRGAAPQRFTGVGHLLPARRVGRDQVTQHRARIAAQRQLLFDLLAVYDRHALAGLADGTVTAQGADCHRIQLQHIAARRTLRRQRLEAIDALRLAHHAQAAALQQTGEAFLERIAALQARAAVPLQQRSIEREGDAGRTGISVERLGQRAGGNVEGLLLCGGLC